VTTTARLEPIEHPKGLLMRLAYWMAKRRLGKVPTVMKVVYARSLRFTRLGWSVMRYHESVSLPKAIALLVSARVSEVNGCGFCLDMARTMAVEAHLGLEKFEALPEWRTSSLFSERERTALEFAEEATRGPQVSDAVFERVRKSFSEREIVELTALVAIENFYNRIAIPLGIHDADGLCVLAQKRAAA
jgi:alkylhydroperoxidase family enzyme